MDLYLDTNAVSYFDAHPPEWHAGVLAQARARLVELVDNGSVSVFVSYVLLEELLGIFPTDPEKYARVMDFVWRVGKNNLLLATDELGRVEARKGGRLEGNERLEWWINAVTVRRECRNTRALRDIPELMRQGFERFEQEEGDRRDEARRRLETETRARPHEGSRRWWGDAETHVNDWVRDFMENSRERLRLPQDRAQWPAPNALESIWRFHVYKMARIHLNVGEGRRVRGSDLYDAYHYVAASYTDLMVTDDADSRATCVVIPRQRFVLNTFKEFVESRLGIDQH